MYGGLLIWWGLFPVDLANPVHNSRIQSTFIHSSFYRENIPTEKENSDIVYQVDNYAESLSLAMQAERHKIDEYYNVDDLVLRGLVFVPKGDGYSQIYQPIYEGASNKVMYYGAGTTHPFRYMGENHFTTIGHNMSDSYKSHPSFYSAMQDYSKEMIGSHFWSTDGQSIFEWTIDSVFVTSFDNGQIQDLDSNLPGAKYSSDQQPRMTLITCLVDDSYYTRRPENRIVMSGYLNGRRLIAEDFETAFKLFPELGSMKRVVGREKGKDREIVSQPVAPSVKSGENKNDMLVNNSQAYVQKSERKNTIIRNLFYNYSNIFIVWGFINLILLAVIIVRRLLLKK